MSELALELWGRWAAALWRTTWQASLLVLVIVLLNRVVTKVSPSLRAWAWWLVCAKLLLGVLLLASVSVPLLPAPAPVEVVEQVLTSTPMVAATPLPAQADFPWAGLGWTAWFIWVAVGVERLVRQHRSLASLIERAAPVDAVLAQSVLTRLCNELGLTPPRLLASTELTTPVLTGLLRPTILLPVQSVARLDEAELTLALAHELGHLRRHDLWWGWVPSIAQVLVGFLPPTWVAVREYTQAREEACDAFALATTGRDPELYARLLISFGVGGRAHAPAAAAGASPHFHHLKRRLLMLGSRRLSRRFPGGLAVALSALGVVPFTVVAKEGEQPTARASVGTGTSRAYASSSVSLSSGASTDSLRFVFVRSTGPQDGMSMTMSGSSDDITHVQQLSRTYGSRFLWFVRDGREYVITDADKLAPLEVAEPAAIAATETRLNQQQADLSLKEAQLSEEQAALSLEQAKLSTQRAELASKAAHAGSERERSGFERQEEALDAKGEALDRQSEALDRRQEALGRQQEALGAEQEKLGELQAAQGERVERAIVQLIDRSLEAGWARPVGR